MVCIRCTQIIRITLIYADRGWMIEIRGLIKAFENVVLKYPDIIAYEGDFVLLCGDSGTGKSTLCEMIAKFLVQDAGEIRMECSGSRNVFENIHYLSQCPDHNLIGPTCYEEIELWLENNSFRFSVDSFQEVGGYGDFIKNRLSEFLLNDYIDMPVWKLSFGKKKALAFCCISTIKRAIWVLDEPFAGLDRDMIVVVKKILHEFLEKGGIVIATSHSNEGYEDFNVKRFEV